MAELKKQYNFGGHKFDAALYLLNLRDNAESFLNSKTDWTPEQKEEWKHSYTNFTNALLDLINNGTDRFSTDEFGTIIDRNGEFSNTDSDNFYYNNKGLQISLEDYDKLKARKLGKYQTFEANRHFASYANLIGKGLRDALAAKLSKSGSEGFDYAKNGFDAYWLKKYNPAGTANDMKPYWAKDNEGEYTNRISDTLADLDDYMANQEMDDKVKSAYLNYRDTLAQYDPKNKDFNLDKWKNNLIIAANRAGIGNWNNGFFNIGTVDGTASKKSEPFDINNDLAVIDKYGLLDQIDAHPELRDKIIAAKRREYQLETQDYIDADNAAIKLQLEVQNNKIWELWLANEGKSYGDVSKRQGIKWYGNYHWSKNTDPEYLSAAGRLALKNLQAVLAKTHWDSDAEGLFTPMKSTLSNGIVLNNLGEHLAYYLPMLKNMGAKFDDNFEEVTDNAGHKLWRVKNSKNKNGLYLYIWNKANGRLGAYRDVPFVVKKAEVTKAFYGVKILSREEKEAAKEKENLKLINSTQTPHELKVALKKQEKIGGNPFSDRATFLRTTALATDVGALVASFSGVGAPASALVGAAATVQNLVADVIEGQGFWESLGNNAIGYGMDALSVLPFVRGITGTGRIVKTASKLAPHIITALGAYSTLKNKDLYLKSWSKMTSNPSLLNRLDWSNIYDSLRLVLSGTTAGTLAIKGNRAMKGAISKDKVKVKTNEGYVAIDKSKLEGIKNTKGLEALNKALQQATGNNNLKFNAARNRYLFWKTKDLANIKESDVYDFTKLNTRIINGEEYERPYKWGELGIANHQWQAPKWMNNILDRIETSGLKKTGRTLASIEYENRRTSPNYTVALLRELHNKLSPMVSEWKSLLSLAQSARKGAADALNKARKAKDPQIKENYESSARIYLNYVRNKATEYLKLKGNVKNGKLSFDLGNSKTAELTWRDLLKKYNIKYKLGGSILKLSGGDVINGSPYASLLAFGLYDPANYASAYTGELKGMLIDGFYGVPYTSLGIGLGLGRIKTDKNYSTFTDLDKEKAKSIENQLLYKNYTDALIKSATDYLNTPEVERAVKWNKDNNEFLYWAEQFDNQYKAGDKGRFFSSPGILNTSWKTTNNDSYNNPAGSLNDLISRIKAVRNDLLLAGAHNDREKEGKRYFWEENGEKHWVDAANIDKIDKDKFNIDLFGDSYGDNGTHWNDYKITAKSKTATAEEKESQQPNNLSLKDTVNNIDVTDKWGIPRAMDADITNIKVTDLLKKLSLLLDSQEDNRYIQSDLDAEIDGQRTYGNLKRLANLSMTSDGNLQAAILLDAEVKGNEAITLKRQLSNLRLRDTSELALQLGVVNHTNRHQTTMLNRLSTYNTNNENNSLEAAYLNLKFTVWDALAQEKEFKEKSDYEQMRARADLFAQQDINNSIKYGLNLYYKKYGLNEDDLSLWNLVYVDGTTKLDDVLKDPAKLRLWNKILSATRLLLSDLLGEYYNIPKSKYWTIRLSTPTYNYSTEFKTAKKGGRLNLSKVREAAKGEKLAAALLKAQTADADRFYKTTKDHIDRMYDAINRLTNYSSTKKKRKKSK